MQYLNRPKEKAFSATQRACVICMLTSSVSSPAHRDTVNLEESQRCRRRVGVEAVSQLVQVVSRLSLHLNHLCPRGDVLLQRRLVPGGEERYSFVQLIEQRDVNGAEASVERWSLVSGRDIHEVCGLGLVVQVVHSGDQASACVHLKLTI